jgi:hypothetical protein
MRPYSPGIHPAGLVALGLALALQAVGGGRAAVLEGVAIGLEALEGQIALFPGHRADAVQGALFGMHDGIGPLGIERAGDRLGRVVVGEAFLLAPQLAGVDQRADAVVIPQQRLGLGAVEPPIGAEVLAAFSQFRGLANSARIIARRVGCSDTEAGVSANATGIS